MCRLACSQSQYRSRKLKTPGALVACEDHPSKPPTCIGHQLQPLMLWPHSLPKQRLPSHHGEGAVHSGLQLKPFANLEPWSQTPLRRMPSSGEKLQHTPNYGFRPSVPSRVPQPGTDHHHAREKQQLKWGLGAILYESGSTPHQDSKRHCTM